MNWYYYLLTVALGWLDYLHLLAPPTKPTAQLLVAWWPSNGITPGTCGGKAMPIFELLYWFINTYVFIHIYIYIYNEFIYIIYIYNDHMFLLVLIYNTNIIGFHGVLFFLVAYLGFFAGLVNLLQQQHLLLHRRAPPMPLVP